MHLEILDEMRIDLLKRIVSQIDSIPFYMAGGTALSLQLGLRKSVDFDFFVPEHFTPQIISEQLRKLAKRSFFERTVDTGGTCDVVLDGVQVSFFYYPYKMIREYVDCPEIPGLKMASPDDIAAMKAVALGNRGAKKDFFDMYYILHLNGFSPLRIARNLYAKFGVDRDFSYIAMGLNYFEDAEGDRLPDTFVSYDWSEIRKYFSAIQQEFMQNLISARQCQ